MTSSRGVQLVVLVRFEQRLKRDMLRLLAESSSQLHQPPLRQPDRLHQAQREAPAAQVPAQVARDVGACAARNRTAL